MIEIKEVKTQRELRQFIRFGNRLYKDCSNYTPVLELDDIGTFTQGKNPALDHCQYVNYLALRNGDIVGRISGIINPLANEHWGVKKVRFGWFDFEDDYEISKTLLDTVADWGKKNGMDTLNGPVGFTDLDHQGLLLRGYEYQAPMASLYNFPYYESHYERYGLTKEADWKEYRVTVPKEVPERMQRVSEMILSKNDLRIDKVKSRKELMDKYGYTFFDVIDQAYQPLYNVQPLTEKQKHYYTDMYVPLLNWDFVTIVVNSQNEIVGVGLGMPDISSELKRCNGRLFPTGWFHLLKALKSKHIEIFNLLLIAVRPDYQNKGVNALFFYDQVPYFNKYGIKYAETTAILEDNIKNASNFFRYFETEQHKLRRAYIKTI